MTSAHVGRPSVMLGGVDISEYVSDMEIRREFEPIGSGEFNHRLVPAQVTVSISASDVRAIASALLYAALHDDVYMSLPDGQLGVNFFAPGGVISPAPPINESGAAPLAAPDPAESHDFRQDPHEEATLCVQCGMWPEHHNHYDTGDGRGCVCQECHPNAEEFEEDGMVSTCSESRRPEPLS